MILNIEPNYELFVQILFAFYILKAALSLIVGLTGVERWENGKHYGIIEALTGLIMMVIILWVLTL